MLINYVKKKKGIDISIPFKYVKYISLKVCLCIEHVVFRYVLLCPSQYMPYKKKDILIEYSLNES